jgi:hypothetical protein
MAIKRNTSHKKAYVAIILIVVLIVSTAAIIYAQTFAPKTVAVGVHVGDSFTYKILGISTLTDLNAVDTPGFSQYNQTDYYKVTVTSVNGSSVTLDTTWRFLNGTEIYKPQTIDLSNGNKTDPNGFWAIYAANLKVNDLIRPNGYDGLTVNLTDTKTYADSTRARNYWFIDNEFFDVNDPTHNTLRYDITGVWFDKQTGILVSLTDYTEYNNPAMTEVITWTLVNSTVWNV